MLYLTRMGLIKKFQVLGGYANVSFTCNGKLVDSELELVNPDSNIEIGVEFCSAGMATLLIYRDGDLYQNLVTHDGEKVEEKFITYNNTHKKLVESIKNYVEKLNT